LVGVHQRARRHVSLIRRAELHLALFAVDLERPENLEIHFRLSLPRTLPPPARASKHPRLLQAYPPALFREISAATRTLRPVELMEGVRDAKGDRDDGGG